MTVVYQADLSVDGGRLETDRTLYTAVTISLLSHARAEPDDVLPEGSGLHGWWGDAYSEQPGDRFGSRLWTLRGRSMQDALALAPRLAEEALAWMIEDGLADEVTAAVEPIGSNQIGLSVQIRRGGTDIALPAEPWVLVL